MRSNMSDEEHYDRERKGGTAQPLHNVLQMCEQLPQTGNNTARKSGSRSERNRKVSLINEVGMKKKLSAVCIFIAMLLVFVSGCGNTAVTERKMTVQSSKWSELGGSTSDPVVYTSINKGELLYEGFDSKIKVKSVSNKKLVLDIDGYLVETEPDGRIDMRKTPLNRLTLEVGQSVELATLTMDAGAHISISFE